MNARRLLTAAAALAAVLLSGDALAQAGPKPPDTAAPTSPASPPPSEPATPAAPPAAPAAPAAAAPAAKPSPKGPQVWGFLNLQLVQTKPPAPGHDSSTFEARRVRLGVRGDVTPFIGYAALYDFADSSLKDGYVSLKGIEQLPGLELRFGQWKTPFGYEQPESDTKLLWVYSSYVVQALARSTTTSSVHATPDARDLGAGVLGRWGGPALGAELAASVTNGAGPNRKDDLDTKNLWGRAGLFGKAGPLGLRAGGSYGHGQQLAGLGANGKFDGVGVRVDDTTFWFDTWGGDLEVDTPWLFVAGEYVQSKRKLTVYTNATTSTDGSFKARGWYVGAYGKTPWNFGPVLRVDQYDRDSTASDDTAKRTTLGAYVDALPVNARLVLNYELDGSQKKVKVGDRLTVFAQVIF